MLLPHFHFQKKIMTEVFGTFLLSKNAGQYSGEFFNNKMKAFSKEEIKLIEKAGTDDFVGNFDANWEESAGRVNAVLQIDLESEDIYMLTWTDVRLNGELQNINFTGRGVVRNGLLVAVYSMNSLHFSNS